MPQTATKPTRSPGFWHTNATYGGKDSHAVYSETGEFVCSVIYPFADDCPERPTEERREGNARFIELGPAAIAALKGVLRYCVTPAGMPDKNKGRTRQQQDAYDAARAVIAKAEALDE